MRLPRILTVPVLISTWFAPVVAQAPQNHSPAIFQNPFSSQPLPGTRIPSLDFHSQFPRMFPGTKDGPAHYRISPSTIQRKFNLFAPAPNALYAFQMPSGANPPSRQQIAVAGNEGLCYAIRGYRFSRVTPESDATKLSGTSTCEPAGQFRPKMVR